MNGREARRFLEEMYSAVCAPSAGREVTDRYFTDDYVQIVDGEALDREAFDAHLATLRADLVSISFEFTTVIAEGNRVADVHFATTTRKDGSETTMKFIGVYTFREGRISRFEEISYLVDGSRDDLDLGQRDS